MSRTIKLSLLLSFLIITIPVLGQTNLKRADKYAENYQYIQAIKFYKKAASGERNQEALIKLADCYRIIKNYELAEVYYRQGLSTNLDEPMVHFNFAQVLLNNYKFDEAKKEFSIYSNLKKEAVDKSFFVRLCEQSKAWITQPVCYQVQNIKAINTAKGDYCPAIFKNGLVFVSETNRDLVSGTASAWNGNPLCSVFFTKITTQHDSATFAPPKILSRIFNNQDQNGPVSFTKDEKEIYFTRILNEGRSSKSFVSHSKIFTAQIEGASFKRVVPLSFNNNSYSIQHPAVSSDGQKLYFASNMPGGFGGFDLYVALRNGIQWANPVNLGAIVNSAYDEVFPYVVNDSVICFSSNGHSGFGGLDIFSSTITEQGWTVPANFMPPINSTTDDFGITFSEPDKGYFSSNRHGGLGGDDIYSFQKIAKSTAVEGRILLSRDIRNTMANRPVILLSSNGDPLQTTVTDPFGYFRFENLKADQVYMIKLDESDTALLINEKYFLADKKNRIVMSVLKNKNGSFVFENLPSDISTLSQLDEDDAPLIAVSGTLLMGDAKQPLVNKKVSITNDLGSLLQTTITNQFGSFVFSGVAADKKFNLLLDSTDSELKNKNIYLVNKNGKMVGTTKKGHFNFEVLPSDKNALDLLTVDDAELRLELRGKIMHEEQPLPNTHITISNKAGELLQTIRTDNSGTFAFKDLPMGQALYMTLSDKTELPATGNYYIVDPFGKVIGKMNLVKGKFNFEFLPNDQSSMSYLYVDDPWLTVGAIMQSSSASKKDSLIIIENIYYNFGDYKILPEAAIVLNKVAKVMQDNPDILIDLYSHTDSRAGDEYNLMLSQKRAKTAVKYLISKGINSTRLFGKGFGESKPINECKDKVECTEQEHAKNRRTEFKITRKK